MPMVKLVSEVGRVVAAGISGIGGCCISWKCLYDDQMYGVQDPVGLG